MEAWLNQNATFIYVCLAVFFLFLATANFTLYRKQRSRPASKAHLLTLSAGMVLEGAALFFLAIQALNPQLHRVAPVLGVLGSLLIAISAMNRITLQRQRNELGELGTRK